MPIMLDENEQSRGPQPQQQPSEQEQGVIGNALKYLSESPQAEEAIDRMDKDPLVRKQMEKMQAEADINRNLAQEVLTMLFDDEQGYLWGSDSEYRYLDLEQEPVFNYDTLRRGGSIEAARLIKNYRQLQLMNYAKPASSKKSNSNETGFSLRFRDNNYQPTQEERATLDRMTLLLCSGFFFPPYSTTPDFSNFLKVMYEDWFDLDDITIETRRRMDGTPLAFHIVDPKYIKPIVPQFNHLQRWDRDIFQAFVENPDTPIDNLDEHGKQYDYIFEKKKKRYAKYTSDYMYKAHFFASSDFRRAKRGNSIVAQGIRILTYILNALTMNSSNFTLNRTPQGLLAITGGSVNVVQLEKIRRLLTANMTGAQNRNRLPILGTPEKGDIKYVHFRESNKEMEYHLWMTLLFSIFCQFSGTNPEVLALASNKASMQTNSFNRANDDRVYTESNDNGLRMFVMHIENILNRADSTGKNVWERITGLPVQATFSGKEIKNEKLSADLNRKRLETDTSINDLLADQDKGRQEFMFGGVNIMDIRGISNPQIFTAISQMNQQQQQEKMQRQQMQAGAGGQQPPQEIEQEGNDYTDRDRELIAQYGEPEQPEGEGQGQEENEYAY